MSKKFPDASGKTQSGLADESYVGPEQLQGISFRSATRRHLEI